MKRIASSFQNIDLFGKPLIFEENGSQTHHTLVGNLLTLSVIVTCCVIGFMFGNEIYRRKNPTVISSEEIIEVSRFSFKEYPLLFSFIYFDGSPINDAHLAFNLKVGKIEVSEKFENVFTETKGWPKPCNASNYDEKYQEIVGKILADNTKSGRGLNDIICPDPDTIIQNGYMTLNSTFVNYRFSLCNPDERKCHPNQSRIAQDFYIILWTVDAFIDPKNYTDPIVYYANTNTYQVSSIFMKRNFFNIEKRKLITYQGWLLDSFVEKEFFTVKEIQKEINPTFRNELFQATFASPNRRNVTIRRYMKVQDLLASIGGFFNFLYILTMILLKDYVKFDYYLYYLNALMQGKDKVKSNSKGIYGSIQMLIDNEQIKEEKNLMTSRNFDK